MCGNTFLCFQGDADEGELTYSGFDSDADEVNGEMNPLLVSLSKDQPSREELTEKWFSQEIFQDDIFSHESESDDEEPLEVENPKVEVKKKTADFEIVPAEPLKNDDDDSSSSSSESDEDLDDEEKAETLACAKKMLRKKTREKIIDDAYNKYMFDDEGLPDWFLEEERKHRQATKPVTKEEMAAMRAQFREIDARPAKKVAEAKARKKRVAMKKLDKARQKANSISDMTDINDRSKGKMIEQVYRKAVPKRPQKEYVVAKKGVQVRPGKGKVLVDRRMKKDARGSAASRKGKKAGKAAGKRKGTGSSKKMPNNKKRRGS